MKQIRKLLISCVIMILTLTVTGCCISHEWQEATCEKPKTCVKCGKTEGEALGHKWEPATCTTPKTCSVCGKTEGDALGHKWEDATCTKAKTCSICEETEGKPLGHSVDDWVIEKRDGKNMKIKYCKNCGEELEKKEYVLPYFKMTFEQYMDELNRIFKGDLTIKQVDSGFKLYLGRDPVGIVFNEDLNEVHNGGSAYSTEKKVKFNQVTLRSIYTGEDQIDRDAFNLTCVLGVYMSAPFNNLEMNEISAFVTKVAQNMEDDYSFPKLMKKSCVINGINYTIEAKVDTKLGPTTWYEFTIQTTE